MIIGFDVTPLTVPQSGVGTYTRNLLEHLDAERLDNIIPLSHQPLALATTAGCQWPLASRFVLNKTLWMQVVLPWQLSRTDMTVAHFTNSVAPLFAPCNVVVTIHDMTLWLFPEYHYGRRLLAMRPFIPIAARRASAIITVSESAKRDIVRILGVAEQKVHVVYEAPPPAFRPLAPRSRVERVRARYHLPEKYILYVGTIEPRKNLVRLLEAFAHLRRMTARPYALVFVGSRGWKDRPVFEAVERLGLQPHVRFLNHVPTNDLVALYNLAELLAFPSLYEGFGLPLVEAMACGTPVVTSRNGALGEVAADAAEFVEPLDVESITTGLQRVLEDGTRREELRHRGLSRASSFTWRHAATKTREVYVRACG